MIKTRKDLKDYIEADINNSNEIHKHMLKELIKGNMRTWTKYKYICALRKMEFCKNNRNGLFGQIRYLFHKIRFQKLQLKTQIFIHPNVFDQGLNIEHPGFIWIDEQSKIGKNCRVIPPLLIGNNGQKSDKPIVIIGDNCFLSTGVTILGPVKIGNNVTIGAGAVVRHDIPDNAIVAGVPARIIRFKE